jgi:hypothetical protein
MSTCGSANSKKGPNAQDAMQEINTPCATAPPQAVDEWLCGYAAALAAVQRLYDGSTLVAEVMKCDGLTIDHLRAAGVEEFDLKQILRAVK